MSDENVQARHAANVGGLQPGRMYLGRIVRVNTALDGSFDTINVYGEGSTGIGDPITTIGVGRILTTLVDAPIPTVYGHFVDGMFCGVEVGEQGKYSLQIFGLDFAWFAPSYVETPGDSHYKWTMKGENGITEVYRSIGFVLIPFSNPPAYEFYAEPPFLLPFDYHPGWAANGIRDPALVSPKTALFVSATGINDVYEEPWRMEYQACNPDDELNDVPPGIRAAWNYLAANCCSGPNDDGGNGPPGDDGDPPDDPVPPGGFNCGNRDEVTLTCLIVNQECIGTIPRPHTYHRWCLLDGELDCFTETGGSCHCDTRADFFGVPIPGPMDVPLGTVIVVGCGLEGTQTIGKCSETPPGTTCTT